MGISTIGLVLLKDMQYALFNRRGNIVKQFERYDAAIKFHEANILKA